MATGKTLSRRDFLRGLAVVSIGVVGVGGILLQQAFVDSDALQNRIRFELKAFTDWLTREGVRGYLGEMNWPNDKNRGFGDEEQWNALGEKWYRWADAANLWVTMWCVDESQLSGGFWLTTYVSAGDGKTRPISEPMAQAPVLEAHPTTTSYERGINVSGAERWDEGTNSNANRGTYDVDYWYASQETMDYLASRGMKIIRLPFRWERIQPPPDGPLDPEELSRLKECVARAKNAGLGVILDLHNYAEYWVEDAGGPKALKVGSPELPVGSFEDVWRRLSNEFKDESAVEAYDLMNEPYIKEGIPAGVYPSPQLAWEVATQGVVSTIRSNGDAKLLMIPGYAHIQEWPEKHPRKWISDPFDNHMYTAHHYFDPYRGPDTGGGKYRFSYDDENAYSRSQGY